MYTRVINRISTSPQIVFQNRLSNDRLLNLIDEVWRHGELFQNKPKQNFINSLVHYATFNQGNSLPLEQNSQNTFSQEFYKLSIHPDFDNTRKAIMLTQTLELALFGVDTTPVLKKINQSHFINQDNTRGYRQELLAAWFLAKFVYDLKNNPQNFTVQAKLAGKEVDIVTHDAFVSVKDYKAESTRGEQIRHLFLILLNAKLPANIRKIILIKGTADPLKYNPKYNHSVENRLRLFHSFEAERDFLFKEMETSMKYLSVYDNLKVTLLYTPPPDELESLNEWIKENYLRLSAVFT